MLLCKEKRKKKQIIFRIKWTKTKDITEINDLKEKSKINFMHMTIPEKLTEQM